MKRSVYLIIFVSMIFQTSVKGNIVMSTLYAIHLGASPFTVGMVAAIVSLFPMILAVYAGKSSDRFGYRLPLLFGSIVASAALSLPAIIQHSLFILFITQFMFGLGQIFFQVSIQNLIGALSNKANRTNHFTYLGLATSVASLTGPLITGFAIDYINYVVSYIIMLLFALLPGICVIFLSKAIPKGVVSSTDPMESERKGRVTDLIKSPMLRKAFMTSGIILTGVGLYSFYFPIYGRSIGLSASIIGIVISVHASAFFVVRLIMPFLIRKYQEEKILMYSLVVTAMAFMFIPFFENVIMLALISFMMGLGLGGGQPLSTVMAYNRSPLGRTGEVLGVRLAVNKMAQFAVPIIFGSLGSMVGFFPIFWSNALMFLVGGFLIKGKGGGKQG